MKLVFISPLFAALASANVYLHSPRGSNNRLNENSAQNSEPKRLFYSNNNRRGGYNVGDKTDNPFTKESGQYAMKYFQGGKSTETNDGGDSLLTIEWTNLVGCGADEDGDRINNCDIVLQRMCQDNEIDSDGNMPSDSFTIRNGIKREQMPYKRNLKAGVLDDPAGKCFQDHHDRDLPKFLGNIPNNQPSSIEWCRKGCLDQGYLYAGVQYHYQCFCGNDFGKHGEKPQSDCNRDCRDSSNPRNKCGGAWRNNIYLTFTPSENGDDETQQEKTDRRSVSLDKDIGLQESWEFFDRCNNQHQEKSTFGARYGMECLAERENFPYVDENGASKITPWTDIAYLTDDTTKCTSGLKRQNQLPHYECVEFHDDEKKVRKHWSKHTNQTSCSEADGWWVGFYKNDDILNKTESECEDYKQEQEKLGQKGKKIIWAAPMVWKDVANDEFKGKACLVLPKESECLAVPATRSGYLGDTDNSRETPRFQWKLPSFENVKRCIFRIRYMVTPIDNSPITHDNNEVMIGGDLLELAVTPKSTVFEDRSHVFEIVKRPTSIPETLTIHNLVVRGKRGNIVQTFPAVEYDFVPNRLNMNQGEAVHIQWAGSNTHKNGNPAGDGQAGDAGEGRSGTDRNNFIQLVDRKANLVAPFHNHTLVKGSDWVWSSHEMGKPENKDFNLALSLATSGYYQCNQSTTGVKECAREFDNKLNDQLNNAPASYGGNVFIPGQGEFHYKCMRNDNFSNRSQKGTIVVI